MPVYNCRQYIEESVNSILNQTYTDFEFIIIDDCSTDGTFEYLSSLADSRINLIRKPKNSGYTISLNMGLEIAKGEYVARMDGDDISLSDRFAKQVNFMDNNQDVVVCGGAYEIIGSKWKFVPKCTNDEIIFDMMSVSVIAHPTAFFRNSILKENNITYNKDYEPAEDYKMWTLLSEYGKLANLNDVLLYYRMHPNQTSSLRAKSQNEISKLISLEFVKNLSKGNENINVFFKLNSVDDLVKYESVEANILDTLKERGIRTNTKLFLERKQQILVQSLTENKYSLTLAKKKYKFILKSRPMLGYSFICKYFLRCIKYSLVR